MFPAYHAFHRDPGRTYTRWVVYTALVDALDFSAPREMKLDAIVAMCKVSRTAAAEAREFLITHGYLIEHTRDRRGLPTLTLAYNIGDPMTTSVVTPTTTSGPSFGPGCQHPDFARRRIPAWGATAERWVCAVCSEVVAPPEGWFTPSPADIPDRVTEVVRLAGLFLDHLGHQRAEVATPHLSHRTGGELWQAIRELVRLSGGLEGLRLDLRMAYHRQEALADIYDIMADGDSPDFCDLQAAAIANPANMARCYAAILERITTGLPIPKPHTHALGELAAKVGDATAI